MAKRINVTHHAKRRYKQRYEGEFPSEIMVRRASHYGLKPFQLRDGAFKDFIMCKSVKRKKSIRILEGYVFIFTKGKRSLITMYRVPERFENEYLLDKPKELKNYAEFKKAKQKRKERKNKT